MTTQQETVGTSQHFGIDNLTYDLITLIHEKSKGLEAFDQYIQDAQGNQQALSLFHQCRQNDEQAINQLMNCLKQVIGK
jgi:hypothetical protein